MGHKHSVPVVADCPKLSMTYKHFNRNVNPTEFDPQAYMGEWWEISRNANPFQTACQRSKAMYTLEDPTSVRIENTCYFARRMPFAMKGHAKILHMNYMNQFHVKFDQVPDMNNDINYVVVATDYANFAVVEGKGYVWILNRKEQICEAEYEMILAEALRGGVDISKFSIFDKDAIVRVAN